MADIVFLNGKYLAKSDAKVSILDRGFLFGDGIYEVIPVYHNKPFRLKEHINRLEHSLHAINIKPPYNIVEWEQLISSVIAKQNNNHLSIYIQITRGKADKRDHLAKTQQLTVLIMPTELTLNVCELVPIKTVLLADLRWQHCDIKSISLLGNILLKQEASARGADEALLHRNNNVTEGATSNIFIVSNNEIFTPVKNQFILGGITRDVIIELAKSSHLQITEKDITVSELYSADEIWVSSSSREISPVTQINDKMVGNGSIGPMTKIMHSAFQQFKQSLIESPR